MFISKVSKALNEALMNNASFKIAPFDYDYFILSQPAKSTKLTLPVFNES